MLFRSQVLKGLVRRRQAEQALFLKDMPQLAEGGITQGPSIAGERGPGHPEAVIPLINGRVPVDLGNLLAQILPEQEPEQTEPAPELDLAAMIPRQDQDSDLDQDLVAVLENLVRDGRRQQEASQLLLRSRIH